MICSKCGATYSSVAGSCPKCAEEKKRSQYANLAYQNQYNQSQSKSVISTVRSQATRTNTPVRKIPNGNYTSNSSTLASVLRFFFVLGVIALIVLVISSFVMISKDLKPVRRAGFIMLFVGGGVSIFCLWITNLMIEFLEDYQRFVRDTLYNVTK